MKINNFGFFYRYLVFFEFPCSLHSFSFDRHTHSPVTRCLVSCESHVFKRVKPISVQENQLCHGGARFPDPSLQMSSVSLTFQYGNVESHMCALK